MKSLPKAARIFLTIVCCLGIVCFAGSQLYSLPAETSTTLGELVIFITLAAFAGGKKVILARGLKNEESGSMSFGFAITFTALLRFGPEAAVLVGTACSLSCGLFPRKQPSFQCAFNTALGIIEASLGSLVYVWLNGGSLAIDGVQTFIAVLASVGVFFGVNTFGVSTIIALCTKQSPWRVWRNNFLWTAPGYFASASMSALAIALFKTSVPAAVLFALPVLYLIYHTYISYSKRIEEDQEHVDALTAGQQQLSDLYLATIKSFALAVDAKDPHTHQHILRVQRYAVAIAEAMGLSGDDMEAVHTGALLHDIGKLGISESVLLKPGKLSEDEFDQIKKHPEIGAMILDPVRFPWPVLPIVRHHHEKWDGSGYPDGLKGEEIPLTARIMAVADVFDALTSTRSYREAWSHDRAVEWIRQQAGSHFDPQVVDAFLGVIHSRIADRTPLTAGLDPLPKAA